MKLQQATVPGTHTEDLFIWFGKTHRKKAVLDQHLREFLVTVVFLVSYEAHFWMPPLSLDPLHQPYT